MKNDTGEYTAITIGPIIETLNSARKTRELWGASYLFSYIIRKVVEKLKVDTIEVLLPHYIDIAKWENNLGAGLFPDRIFIKGKLDIETTYYKPIIGQVSNSIVKWIENKRLRRKLDSEVLYNYLIDYFRFIQIHFEIDDTENIIEKGTTLLDSKELQTKIIPENEYIDQENPLFYFLYHVNGSFLFDDGFKKTISRFPSLIEIASKELAQIDENKYHLITTQIEAFQAKYENINAEKRGEKHEEDIIELIGDLFGKDFRQVHKYIAIVQADGDKIGQMVTKVGTDPDKIQNFSQKLMEYSRAATDIVVKYGGSPVYMGGDDLFFFAPMTYRIGIKKTHILEMINDLDLKFKEIITFYAKDKLLIKDSELPSLSFGISFSYYKFPLYEAKNLAFSALFEEIKWVDKRNAIKVKFRKHSGQLMELFVNKNKPELWNETIKFISQNIEINAEFLNSFTHKLRLQEDVLFEKIASDKFKLEFFFRNNFNENYNQYSDYFSTIISFIHSINAFVDHKEKKTYLYSVLRFIHFLRS